MNRITKDIRKLIADFAETMPPVMQHTHEVVKVSGDTLIWQGHTVLEDGTKVQKGKIYQQDFPVVMQINHKRRMLESYSMGGQDQLMIYIDAVLMMAAENNN